MNGRVLALPLDERVGGAADVRVRDHSLNRDIELLDARLQEGHARAAFNPGRLASPQVE
jgi:hypothetical protein